MSANAKYASSGLRNEISRMDRTRNFKHANTKSPGRVRQGFRSLEKCVSNTCRQILLAPAELYAAIYIRLRLNDKFHRMGIRGPAELKFLPRALPVSRRLMNQPYWIPLQAIKWGGRPKGGKRRIGSGQGRGVILDGDWDIEDRRPINDYLESYVYSRTIYQLLRDGVPYHETDQYREMIRFIENAGCTEWQARGCATEEDVEQYFHGLAETFDRIRRYGYMTQEQLGSTRWFDEIKVFIDRNGEFHKQQGAGHHRLAMVKILDLPKVPVLVIGIHRQWALKTQREVGADLITSIDRKLMQGVTSDPDDRSVA